MALESSTTKARHVGSSGIRQPICNKDRTKLHSDREGDICNRNWDTTISRLGMWKTLQCGIRSQTPETDRFEANLKYTSTILKIQAQSAKIRYDYKIYTWR